MTREEAYNYVTNNMHPHPYAIAAMVDALLTGIELGKEDCEKWLKDFLRDREQKGEFDSNKTLISDIVFSFGEFKRK